MKIKFAASLLFITGVAFAQVNDSASAVGGTRDVYYKLSNGNQNSAPSLQWDFAFTNILIDASVLSNDAAGVEVYVASSDITDWDKLDTTGFNWERVYNSETSWAAGAFANLGGIHPDYGWGQYNQSNHNVTAKRLFFVKLKDGSWRKMMIEKMETNGNVSFKLAHLDGSNTTTASFNKITNKTFNFTYYDAVKDSFVMHEPATAAWDLNFSKYFSEVAPGSFYPVSGVKVNTNIKVAQRDGIAVTSNDTNGLTYGQNITEIGSDWKTYDRNNNVYIMAADRAYFLKLNNGEIWKIHFTGYVGGPSATTYFTKEMITGGASVNPVASKSMVIYPNPAKESFSILLDNQGNAEPFSLKIMDLKGNVVHQYSGRLDGFKEVSFEATEFNAGVYIVELHSAQQVSRSKLIIR